MAKVGKILIGTGIGAGLIYLLSSLLGKKKLGDKLDTITLASIHKLDLQGLVVRIDVVLKNPTEYSLRIKQPYVRLLIGDKLIGSSQIKNDIIEIKGYSSLPLKNPIYITIPVSGLLSLGGSFYQALVKKQAVTITIHTLTSIDVGSKWIGYDKKDNIALKPKLPAKPKSPAAPKPTVKTKK